MSPGRLRGILSGLIVAALGAMAAPRLGSGLFSTSADPGEMVPVLVARRYLQPLTTIKPVLTEVREYPKAFAPPGFLRNASELQNEGDQFLFSSAVAIPEGQPLTRTLLVDRSQNESLATLLRPGKVAVSFEVDRSRSVGGWIKPGDTVAIFRLVPPDETGRRNDHRSTRLLLPAAAIAAVDRTRLGLVKGKVEDAAEDSMRALESSPGESRVVTILVNPIEATALIEAREQGPLSVVLRAPGDDLPWTMGN